MFYFSISIKSVIHDRMFFLNKKIDRWLEVIAILLSAVNSTEPTCYLEHAKAKENAGSLKDMTLMMMYE